MYCVIGGGFFGLYIALYLSEYKNQKVILFEQENGFMQKASYNNQARVHNGYHYPRSVLTALRSHFSFPRFCKEFHDCIDGSFEKYYMVGSFLSKIGSKQFKLFCQRLGLPLQETRMFDGIVNPHFIEATYKTQEYVFDAIKIRNRMLDRLNASKVEYHLNTTVSSIAKKNGKITVTYHKTDSKDKKENIAVKKVFNCTYAGLNHIKENLSSSPIALKHEITEICLVEVPEFFKEKGITIMCGPFFSFMPFPSKGLHSFSHVRYTPHCEWNDVNNVNPYDVLKLYEKNSTWSKMQQDAIRYIPAIKDFKYKESLWEIKTVLPRCEVDDARPILFKKDSGVNELYHVLGGKIDNIYDAVEIINNMQ
jgi:glycine/D-amino acid oxidase-like deaminating enzyme